MACFYLQQPRPVHHIFPPYHYNHYPFPLPTGCWTVPLLILHAHIYAAFSSVIHLTLKMEAARSSEMLVLYHNTIWEQNPEHLNLDIQLSFYF